MCLNLVPIPSHRPSFSVTSDAYCTEIWNPKTCWSTNPVLSKLLTSVWPGLSVSQSGCTLTRSSPCGTEPLKSSWEPASTHAPSTSGQLVASSRKWQTKDHFSRYTLVSLYIQSRLIQAKSERRFFFFTTQNWRTQRSPLLCYWLRLPYENSLLGLFEYPPW